MSIIPTKADIAINKLLKGMKLVPRTDSIVESVIDKFVERAKIPLQIGRAHV